MNDDEFEGLGRFILIGIIEHIISAYFLYPLIYEHLTKWFLQLGVISKYDTAFSTKVLFVVNVIVSFIVALLSVIIGYVMAEDKSLTAHYIYVLIYTFIGGLIGFVIIGPIAFMILKGFMLIFGGFIFLCMAFVIIGFNSKD